MPPDLDGLAPLGDDFYRLALPAPLTPDAFPHLADVRTDTRTCTTCGAAMRDHVDEGRDQCRYCWSRA